MMTQTHLLLAAGLLTRRGDRKGNVAVVLGSLVPDIGIYVLFVWAVATGIPQETLWSETYWTASWQALFAVGNSVPLALILMGAGLWLARRADAVGWRTPLLLFSLAVLTHLAGDFPLHHDDAHQHFWPLSEWRFVSPVSYWDSDHHAGVIAPLEAALGIGLAIALWRRFDLVWIRAVLALTIAAYLAVPVFFLLSLGTGATP